MNTDVMFSSKDMCLTTPQDFYDALNLEFNFTLDPCSSHENHKCDKYYTIEEDGLSKDWSGHTVFCNPPYGRELPKWVEKCYHESRKPNTMAVMLIPARTDTRWYHDYIYQNCYAEVRMVKGRLKFGGLENSAPFPSMVVIFHNSYLKRSKEVMVSLYPHQLEALQKLKTGKILYGGVGSGKSRTAIAWYYLENGGHLAEFSDGFDMIPMDCEPKDLYIITTAKKRDKFEWESEMAPFYITRNEEIAIYKHKVVVDSWNNIKKYAGVTGAYFIFDEQRVVGSGVWVKSFLKIARSNEWILLSATPGDSWSDYIPVFIANGYYRNRTEFLREHVVYKPYVSYPVIDKYINTGRLLRLRRNILVPMNFERKTKAHDKVIDCEWDKAKYKHVLKERWDDWKDEPIDSASGLCYCLRRVVNGDESRFQKLGEVLSEHPRCIIFYNYDYELDALKEYLEKGSGVDEVAEWNGHKHQDVPITYSEELGRDKSWVYLVQYNAGAEGWNCTTTDTIIFWSQTYSYKQLQQAKGRIDRLNTPYIDLYYYHFKSKASIDIAISRALKDKKKFNEFSFVNGK